MFQEESSEHKEQEARISAFKKLIGEKLALSPVETLKYGEKPKFVRLIEDIRDFQSDEYRISIIGSTEVTHNVIAMLSGDNINFPKRVEIAAVGDRLEGEDPLQLEDPSLDKDVETVIAAGSAENNGLVIAALAPNSASNMAALEILSLLTSAYSDEIIVIDNGKYDAVLPPVVAEGQEKTKELEELERKMQRIHVDLQRLRSIFPEMAVFLSSLGKNKLTLKNSLDDLLLSNQDSESVDQDNNSEDWAAFNELGEGEKLEIVLTDDNVYESSSMAILVSLAKAAGFSIEISLDKSKVLRDRKGYNGKPIYDSGYSYSDFPLITEQEKKTGYSNNMFGKYMMGAVSDSFWAMLQWSEATAKEVDLENGEVLGKPTSPQELFSEIREKIESRLDGSNLSNEAKERTKGFFLSMEGKFSA